jgi:dipeptide/tripeptide permease
MFWVANTLELFERLAYYGATAVLAVFLASEAVGLEDEAGSLTGFFSGVIYSLPVVAGVFVDRYGFRKALMACFAIFSIGYFLIGMAGMPWADALTLSVDKRTYVITVMLFTALGGSLIKPCIVGTVAKTTTSKTKSLGYSIYYTIVNIGGAIGPLLAMPVRMHLSVEYVLVMSAATSFLLMLGTFLFFKEPRSVEGEEPAEKRTFAKLFTDMLLVFGNGRFMFFLLIFSGLYIMFWQIFTLLPFYTRDVLSFKHFEVIETVDAFTIILLTIPLATITRKLKPVPAMTLGFVFASLSWIVIAIGGTIPMTVAGIAVYAVGEAIAAPRLYEYVASLAPKEQIGTYMGFSFMPVSIGSFVGGPIADYLRIHYMETNPAMMWYIISAIGVICTLLLMFYNRLVQKHLASEVAS